jgi:tRNA A-37 threonylcarbamoyl transferase component Bud32
VLGIRDFEEYFQVKFIKVHGIKWFLKDNGLVEFVKNFSHDEGTKRGHFVLEHAGKKIFIKFFKEKGFYGFVRNRVSPRGKKEFYLAGKLISLSIPTPEPLGYGVSDTGSYVMQEWVDGSTFLDMYGAGDQKTMLLLKLADFLNELKQRHIRHNDLHLNNIIYKSGTLYLVDLHKMQIKNTFSSGDEISNLAHSITMVYQDLTEKEKDAFFQRYGNKSINEPLESELKRLRQRWIRKKMERAFDDTSTMITNGNYVYVAGFETYGKGALRSVIKEDKKVKIERYSNHIRKIYRNKRRLNRAWKNHIALTYLNLRITPRAFFVKKPFLAEKGFIAMEDLAGKGEELDRYLDREYDRLSVYGRKIFIDKLSAFFIHAVKQWVIHRDMKACNIFVLENGGFILLDVEDIVFKEMDVESLKRMLIQLNTTIPKRIPTGDRIRFFLKLSVSLKMKNKALFRRIIEESLKSEIVYEGVAGLKVEHW